MISSEPSDKRGHTRRASERRHADVASPTRAVDRVRHLYEISRLLTNIGDIDETFPVIMGIMASVLPLRSAVLIVNGKTHTSTTTWTPDGESQALVGAVAQARDTLADLVEPVQGDRPSLARGTVGGAFVDFPMVIDGVKTFGLLQLEGPVLDEEDVRFVSVVTNQLAVALRRREVEGQTRRAGF